MWGGDGKEPSGPPWNPHSQVRQQQQQQHQQQQQQQQQGSDMSQWPGAPWPVGPPQARPPGYPSYPQQTWAPPAPQEMYPMYQMPPNGGVSSLPQVPMNAMAGQWPQQQLTAPNNRGYQQNIEEKNLSTTIRINPGTHHPVPLSQRNMMGPPGAQNSQEVYKWNPGQVDQNSPWDVNGPSSSGGLENEYGQWVPPPAKPFAVENWAAGGPPAQDQRQQWQQPDGSFVAGNGGYPNWNQAPAQTQPAVWADEKPYNSDIYWQDPNPKLSKKLRDMGTQYWGDPKEQNNKEIRRWKEAEHEDFQRGPAQPAWHGWEESDRLWIQALWNYNPDFDYQYHLPRAIKKGFLKQSSLEQTASPEKFPVIHGLLVKSARMEQMEQELENVRMNMAYNGALPKDIERMTNDIAQQKSEIEKAAADFAALHKGTSRLPQWKRGGSAGGSGNGSEGKVTDQWRQNSGAEPVVANDQWRQNAGAETVVANDQWRQRPGPEPVAGSDQWRQSSGAEPVVANGQYLKGGGASERGIDQLLGAVQNMGISEDKLQIGTWSTGESLDWANPDSISRPYKTRANLSPKLERVNWKHSLTFLPKENRVQPQQQMEQANLPTGAAPLPAAPAYYNAQQGQAPFWGRPYGNFTGGPN